MLLPFFCLSVSRITEKFNAIFGGAGNNTLDPKGLHHQNSKMNLLHRLAVSGTGTEKYDRGLTRIMRDELHWLSVPQRVKFKLGTMMHRCLHNSAPRYLCDYCILVANVAARSQLRSASRHQVVVPATTRARSAVGPSLLLAQRSGQRPKLRDPSLSIDSFRRQLKTFLFAD